MSSIAAIDRRCYVVPAAKAPPRPCAPTRAPEGRAPRWLPAALRTTSRAPLEPARELAREPA